MEFVKTLKNGVTTFKDESHVEDLRSRFLASIVNADADLNTDTLKFTLNERVSFIHKNFTWIPIPSIYFERKNYKN